MDRKTHQAPRRLSAHVIEGIERRIDARGGLGPGKDGSLREVIELRAMARELIGHVNALEEVK